MDSLAIAEASRADPLFSTKLLKSFGWVYVGGEDGCEWRDPADEVRDWDEARGWLQRTLASAHRFVFKVALCVSGEDGEEEEEEASLDSERISFSTAQP